MKRLKDIKFRLVLAIIIGMLLQTLLHKIGEISPSEEFTIKDACIVSANLFTIIYCTILATVEQIKNK